MLSSEDKQSDSNKFLPRRLWSSRVANFVGLGLVRLRLGLGLASQANREYTTWYAIHTAWQAVCTASVFQSISYRGIGLYTTRTSHVRFDSLLLSVKHCCVTMHTEFSWKLQRTDVACKAFLIIFCHFTNTVVLRSSEVPLNRILCMFFFKRSDWSHHVTDRSGRIDLVWRASKVRGKKHLHHVTDQVYVYNAEYRCGMRKIPWTAQYLCKIITS